MVRRYRASQAGSEVQIAVGRWEAIETVRADLVIAKGRERIEGKWKRDQRAGRHERVLIGGMVYTRLVGAYANIQAICVKDVQTVRSSLPIIWTWFFGELRALRVAEPV